jgi:hypothetical protein
MNTYFSTALAVASNNTDVYIGKYWNLNSVENYSLGQARLSQVRGSMGGTRVVCDFAGAATYVPGGPSGVIPTYDPYLRKYVIGTLGFQPTVTVGAEYTGYTEFVYVQSLATNQMGVFTRSTSNNTWYTSFITNSVPYADYSADMFIHTNTFGNANPRAILLTQSGAKYSNTYPSGTASFSDATTYGDGFTKYAFASKAGVTTALGVDGRVRYTVDGINWSGSVIPSGIGTTLRCAAWTTDGNTCLAAGDNGVLALSTDGQTFTLSTALQTTANWGTRRAIAMAADPASPSTIFVVCGDGTLAVSGDYGVTWFAANNLFTINERYDGYPVTETPVKCWIQGGALYISFYGGQTLVTGGLSPCGDVSDGFSGYYSMFGTANITGVAAPVTATPTGTIRAVFAGGTGRVQYMTTGSPFNFQQDLLLFNSLVSLGYNNTVVGSAYYDEALDCTFVGLSAGVVAYRFNPLGAGSWQLAALPGVTGKIIGIAKLPTNNIIVVSDNAEVGIGSYSPPTTISWAVNLSLQSVLSGFQTPYTVAMNNTCVVVGTTNNEIANTTDGTSWFVTLLPFGSPAPAPTTLNITYDPRASTGFGSGLFIAFYESLFSQQVATSTNGLGWTAGSSYLGGASDSQPTGVFTFGTPKISIGIKTNGTGVISTTPTLSASWGSSPGVTYRVSSPALGATEYYPTQPVSYSVGTVTPGANIGLAAGNYGRIWFSYTL